LDHHDPSAKETYTKEKKDDEVDAATTDDRVVVPLNEEECEEKDEQPQPPVVPGLTGGSAGFGDASRIGLEPLAEFHVPDDDTYAVVFRHLRKPWLVVAFRGSASLKHWYTNLRITQHSLSLHDDKPEVYADDGNVSSRQSSFVQEGACPSSVVVDDAEDSQQQQQQQQQQAQKKTATKTTKTVAVEERFSDDDEDLDEDFEDEFFDDDRFEDDDDDGEDGPGGARGGSSSSSSRSRRRRSGDDDATARRTRVVVDTIMRYLALVFRAVERVFGLFLMTAEAAGLAAGAANIPGVDRLVLPCVHSGFWTAYGGVREGLHRAVLEACLESAADRPITRIVVTGHSLGGALATLAATDLAVHALPALSANRGGAAAEQQKTTLMVRKAPRLTLVTFGAPRVGNRVYARIHDALVPDSWRVVADGDVVTGVPRLFFKHAGTPCVVDGSSRKHGNNNGFLVVDPSFIEKRLKIRSPSQLTAHYLESYVRGLYGAAGLPDPTVAELTKFANDQSEGQDDDTHQGSQLRALCAALRPCYFCCHQQSSKKTKSRTRRDAADDDNNTLSAPLLPPSSP